MKSKKLTGREGEMAVLLADDHTVQEAADILEISFFTAQAYARQLRQKFDKRTVAGLIAELFRQNLIQ